MTQHATSPREEKPTDPTPATVREGGNQAMGRVSRIGAASLVEIGDWQGSALQPCSVLWLNGRQLRPDVRPVVGPQLPTRDHPGGCPLYGRTPGSRNGPPRIDPLTDSRRGHAEDGGHPGHATHQFTCSPDCIRHARMIRHCLTKSKGIALSASNLPYLGYA